MSFSTSSLQKKIQILFSIICLFTFSAYSQTDPFSQDPEIKDGVYPGIKGFKVNSGGSRLNVLEYFPTGKGPHPTLILLHGYTGMPGNVDIATSLSRAGWNVIFFRYRGIWDMPGEFSFQHCVEDAVAVTNYIRDSAVKLNVDTAHIVVFGHSMGGWVALKAATKLPYVRKVFALSTWDIFLSANKAKASGTLDAWYKEAEGYAELKIRSGKQLYDPVFANADQFDLMKDAAKLHQKNLFFLDEHNDNKVLVEALKRYAEKVSYEVWKSDHSFTYTRIAMMRALLKFINE